MPFEDSSIGHSEVHTPTITGATIDTDVYKYGGGSGKFDGGIQNVTFSDSSDWDWTELFTISCWVYKAEGYNFSFYLSHASGTSNYNTLYITPTIVRYRCQVSGARKTYIYLVMSELTTGWHHIEVSQDISSGYIFIDGVKKTLTTNNDNLGYSNNNGLLYINKDGWASTYGTSNTDCLKIDKGICRHTADFTPPTDEDVENDQHTVLLLKMNPNIINVSAGDSVLLSDSFSGKTMYVNLPPEFSPCYYWNIETGLWEVVEKPY